MSMEVQFPVNVLLMEIFKALLQDRVQQLVVERMWWMRSCRNAVVVHVKVVDITVVAQRPFPLVQ